MTRVRSLGNQDHNSWDRLVNRAVVWTNGLGTDHYGLRVTFRTGVRC